MGKGKAPEPDPRIGEAALLSAQTGQDYLKMMREQSEISNAWAAEDRGRFQEKFIPLQDEYIEKAQAWASPARQAAVAAQAGATARTQMDAAAGQTQRQMSAMGVNPASGRGLDTTRRSNNATGLAVLGARNTARAGAQGQGMQMLASGVNLGQGLEVNPGTSLGLANSSLSSGFSGAMSGYQQQGSLLNTQYQNQLSSWQAQQQAGSSFWGGLGTVAGAFISDEDKKENKAKPRKSLRRSLDDMRVEEWDYKAGEGDGGHHVGTYAQDFKKATGLGNGRTIDVIDAVGVTMGAVKEISADLKDLSKQVASVKGATGKPTAKQRSI